MQKVLANTIRSLESIKKISQRGGEYWMGRDIQKILGYKEWRNFENTVGRARMACESTGEDASKHFVDTNKKVSAGSDALVSRKDLYLDRYACYLIAMNGETGKPEIGFAQVYFAVQTRKQELQDQLSAGEQRLKSRERVKDRHKRLMATAKNAGVQNYPAFQAAGHQGLYDMGLADIKKAKGLPPKVNFLDYIGRTELAAHEFRITQTDEKLVRDNIKGERNAINTHLTVSKKIRATIKELGGRMPESLPAEPSIRKLASSLKKKNKELTEGNITS